MFFSHGSRHSKEVCILIDPSMKEKLEHSFSNNSDRIALITVALIVSNCHFVTYLLSIIEMINCNLFNNLTIA